MERKFVSSYYKPMQMIMLTMHTFEDDKICAGQEAPIGSMKFDDLKLQIVEVVTRVEL